MKFVKHYWLILFVLLNQFLITNYGVAKNEHRSIDDLEQQLLLCRKEFLSLLRLDCYDKVVLQFTNTANFYLNTDKRSQTNLHVMVVNSADKVAKKTLKTNKNKDIIKRSDIANLALKLESKRTFEDNNFLILQDTDSVSPLVMLTTSALNKGSYNEVGFNPILVFSCADNITQMHIVMFEAVFPLRQPLVFITDNQDKFETDWFVRDNGYLLESSRGLLGIDQIKKLFNSQTLKIEHQDTNLNRLSFDLTDLEQKIVPLRKACRW